MTDYVEQHCSVHASCSFVRIKFKDFSRTFKDYMNWRIYKKN